MEAPIDLRSWFGALLFLLMHNAARKVCSGEPEPFVSAAV